MLGARNAEMKSEVREYILTGRFMQFLFERLYEDRKVFIMEDHAETKRNYNKYIRECVRLFSQPIRKLNGKPFKLDEMANEVIDEIDKSGNGLRLAMLTLTTVCLVKHEKGEPFDLMNAEQMKMTLEVHEHCLIWLFGRKNVFRPERTLFAF